MGVHGGEAVQRSDGHQVRRRKHRTVTSVFGEAAQTSDGHQVRRCKDRTVTSVFGEAVQTSDGHQVRRCKDRTVTSVWASRAEPLQPGESTSARATATWRSATDSGTTHSSSLLPSATCRVGGRTDR
eukprot:1179705-Prorocentrum_minimum.AAC.1